MYDQGKGVAQDDKAAASWFLKSAEQGDAGAQLTLGVMYVKGNGAIQNYIQAHKWWNISVANGNESARRNRDRVAKLMTPSQLEKAQALARKWLASHK